MERVLSEHDRRIWDLHMQGFAPSAISEMTGTEKSAVRAVIAGIWHDDKSAARAARRTRRV
ncbi:hypothetical protein [Adlercreutzia sp. ZJ138]|uniref:hypothetical protein n=1 Tax=Adlercreutzia sp. ZJ138 TaxID=2709405 RepID=UPI0013EBA525|nr:hypothetical protein [Adlercreutzia sp. ZJ138]